MSPETPEPNEIERRDVDSPGASIDQEKSAPDDRATAGPLDVNEVQTMRPYVDLGAIKVVPREGLQMRLDVDEQAKRIVAVSLDYGGSTLQVQAFSAPKSTGLWRETVTNIKKQLSAQGAPIDEIFGVFGLEIHTVVNVPEHRGGGTARVRFIGVDGPRWMLRGSVTGAALTDPDAAQAIEQVFRDLVVVRGEVPMPPNELLPMKVPAGLPGAS